MMPSISVIIPVYNKAHYLGRCLDSILQYRGQEIEVIAIDDCSSDDSTLIIEEYSRKDPRVSLLRNESNKGTFLTRAAGILKAKGRYIFCVDPDDWIDAKCFDHALPHLGKADIIVFNTVSKTDTTETFWGNKGDEFLMGEDIFTSYVSMRLLNWGVLSKLIKTELALRVLKELNIQEHLIVFEDLLLFLPVALFARTYQRIDAAAYYYFMDDEESATRSEFTKSTALKQFSDFKKGIGHLKTIFHQYGYDIFDYTRAFEEAFHFFHAKIYQSSLSDPVKEVLLWELTDIIGGFSIYKALIPHTYYAPSRMHQVLDKTLHLAEKLLPRGSWRRKVCAGTARVGFRTLRFFYKTLRKIYRILKGRN